MPIYKSINKDFFKKWSPNMAYVLGYIYADGSLTKNKRGAHYLELKSIDKELIYSIRKLFAADHKISIKLNKNPKDKPAHRLQIGSKDIFEDLVKLGATPNKSKRIKLPKIPNKYFHHFIRGFFDGDGTVVYSHFFSSQRQKTRPYLQSGFISASQKFLSQILKSLKKLAKINGGTLYYSSRSWRLFFSVHDSKKLFEFIYKDIGSNYYLKRKFIYFKKAIKLHFKDR